MVFKREKERLITGVALALYFSNVFSIHFLIMGKMPHYTKLLMQKWDDPKLALTDEQKKALEKVRKETMSAVLEIKPQLAKLEQEIADKILHGATPDSLKADVEKVAKLKTKATMAHLKCIYDTQKVLTESQLKYLFN